MMVDFQPLLCPNCGKLPNLKFKLFSKKGHFRCKCGVAGPYVEFYSFDNSYPSRMAKEGWDKLCVNAIIKG